MSEIQTPTDREPQRRSFLTEAAAVVAGALLAVVPLAAGLVAFLDPLRRRAGKASFVRVAPLSAVPEDGAPALFQVVADRRNAWTVHENAPVGAVYLRKTESGVEALHSVCPHLGCFVAQRDDQFLCPCHNSAFELNGDRINPENCPSPRAMDSLRIDERKLAETGEVWVEFRNFKANTPHKIDAVTWQEVDANA